MSRERYLLTAISWTGAVVQLLITGGMDKSVSHALRYVIKQFLVMNDDTGWTKKLNSFDSHSSNSDICCAALKIIFAEYVTDYVRSDTFFVNIAMKPHKGHLLR